MQLVEKIPDDLLDQWRRGPLRLARKFPVVSIDGIDLTLVWGHERIDATIFDCRYRRGRAWQMKLASRGARRLSPFGNADLILIDFPPFVERFFGGYHAYTTAPVGYTPESLKAWAAALEPVFNWEEMRG